MTFIYLFYLIVLTRTSSTSLNRGGESEHTCLILDQRIQPLIIEYDVSLSCTTFIKMKYIPYGIFPDDSVIQSPPANAGVVSSVSGSGKISWRSKW